MKVYTLYKKIVIKKPLEEVFRFFQEPENLGKITPSGMGFKILTPAPIKMEKGTVIDYIIHIKGIAQHWQTLITDYDPPLKFADLQLKGPYTFWHHTHRFEAQGDSTIMHDEVSYVLPLGILGRMAHSIFIKSELKRIFDYRERVIQAYFQR